MKKHTFENKTAKLNVKKLQFILLTSSPLICEVMTDACHIIINNLFVFNIQTTERLFLKCLFY